jgi:hypothetical protein
MALIDKERCGIIVYNGGPGDINHEKGVHRKSTSCPQFKWRGVDDPQERLKVCRACRYYLAPGKPMPEVF